LDKKRKEKNSKKREEIEKRAHTELNSSIVCGAFCLVLFPLLSSYLFLVILVSLPCLSYLVLETHIGQQLGQVLWIFIQYCYLLLTCVPHIHNYSFVCLLNSTYTSDQYRKRSLQSWATPFRYPLS